MIKVKMFVMPIAFAFAANTAVAGTELQDALENGGQQLDGDQIAELIVGQVVTAESGGKTFRFFYDPDNILLGELSNGGWRGSGAYAITDNAQVCVSMAADKGRYRCLTVVRDGESVRKYDSSGKMTFELLDFSPATGL